MVTRILVLSLVAVVGLTVAFQGTARCHCEVPCGIYGDLARIVMLREDIATVEKAMRQIEELGAAEKPNFNQIVRWTTTKDAHADKIQDIVTQYFMTQRIKPDQDQYVEKLTTLHSMLISAMKGKQTTDLAHCAALRGQVEAFSKLYFTEADREHLKEHHDGG